MLLYGILFFLLQIAFDLCPHHVSHYLGMDVHDTGLIPRSIPMQSGMVITVEPGMFDCSKSYNNKMSEGWSVIKKDHIG